MRKLLLGKVYPITDSKNRLGLSHIQLAQEFLEAGIRFFQVREKDLPDLLLYQQLLDIKAQCERYGGQFLVNDRVDLALTTGAAGVHLGQTDFPVEEARRLLGENAIIGLSTHTREQFEKAKLYAIDYVTIGPIFATSTKVSEYLPLGIDFLAGLVAESQHPVVAIGGITLANSLQVWDAGASSAAVISDIVNSRDPRKRTRQYLHLAKGAIQ